MKNYTVSIYLTIKAESIEEAKRIALSGLEIRTIQPEDEEKVFWNSLHTEVEEEPA